MLYKKYLIYLLLCCCGIQAQTAISGKLDLKGQDSKGHQIELYGLNLDAVKNSKTAKKIANSLLEADGSFSFKSELFSNQDGFYQLQLNQLGVSNDDVISKSKPFILSSQDSIRFKPDAHHFSNYITTNEADKEWERLRDFERTLQNADIKLMQKGEERKSYLKDSLRILMVKLIAVQQLEDKDLLEQDIAKNSEYYIALLEEFKASRLPPSEYRFFEKKLAFLTQEIVEKKYTLSKVINVVLIVIVLGLIGFVLFRRKQIGALPELSKQESTIKNLILEGKSNKEIANELFISISTVKTHITNIYGKLNVSNRRELLHKTHN